MSTTILPLENSVMVSKTVVPVKGEICTQFIRCGKRECRCQRGDLHGPYYYHVWRDGARVRKVYVKSADVEYMRACCRAYREFSRTLAELKGARQGLSRDIKQTWRETKPLLRAAN